MGFWKTVIRKALQSQVPNFAPSSNISAAKAVWGKDATALAIKNFSFVCMNKRARWVSDSESWAATLKDDKYEPLPDEHWANILMKSPNPLAKWTQRQLKEQLSFWLDWKGNAFLWTPTFGTRYPVQLWLIPATMVEIIPGKNESFIEGYKISLGNNSMYVEPREMCHFKTLFPSTNMSDTYFRGIPRVVSAIETAVEGDEEMIDYINKYFNKNALPPIILTSHGKITPGEKDRLKANLNDVLGAEVTAVLEGTQNLVPLQTMSESSVGGVVKGNITDDIVTRIASAFEVPVKMITDEWDNRAAANAVIGLFRASVVEVILNDIDATLTLHFQQFEEGVEITHEKYKWVDPEQMWEEEHHSYKTVNERRAELGLPALPVDSLLLPAGLQTLPLTQPQADNAPDEGSKKKA